MDRVGVYTTGERRALFEGALGRLWRLDFREGPACPLPEALASWAAAGVAVAVVDDHALDPPGDEAFLIGWAQRATASAPRVVAVFDGTRGAEDPFLYQLVSLADVKDLVVTSVGDTVGSTLPARVERPARLMDVAHWKTADRRKLKRRDGRRFGPFRKGPPSGGRGRSKVGAGGSSGPPGEPPAPEEDGAACGGGPGPTDQCQQVKLNWPVAQAGGFHRHESQSPYQNARFEVQVARLLPPCRSASRG